MAAEITGRQSQLSDNFAWLHGRTTSLSIYGRASGQGLQQSVQGCSGETPRAGNLTTLAIFSTHYRNTRIFTDGLTSPYSLSTAGIYDFHQNNSHQQAGAACARRSKASVDHCTIPLPDSRRYGQPHDRR